MKAHGRKYRVRREKSLSDGVASEGVSHLLPLAWWSWRATQEKGGGCCSGRGRGPFFPVCTFRTQGHQDLSRKAPVGLLCPRAGQFLSYLGLCLHTACSRSCVGNIEKTVWLKVDRGDVAFGRCRRPACPLLLSLPTCLPTATVAAMYYSYYMLPDGTCCLVPPPPGVDVATYYSTLPAGVAVPSTTAPPPPGTTPPPPPTTAETSSGVTSTTTITTRYAPLLRVTWAPVFLGWWSF